MRGLVSMKVPTTRVRELRRHETEAEKRAWHLLRARRAGLKFRRQFPVGSFVVDFYCFEARLAVELDGSAHSQPNQMKKDHAKDGYLTQLGIQVLRLPNGLVLQDPDQFVEKIRECGFRRAASK
jgi:very-short-patch-repair endonuclease